MSLPLFRALKFSLLLSWLLLPICLIGQLAVQVNNTYTIDFDAYRGDGFSPNAGQTAADAVHASPGQLNSNFFTLSGASDGSVGFGGNETGGDFARGTTTGGVGTGGVYAFDRSGGNFAVGFQPSGGDLTPGEIVLRIENTGVSPITELTIAYEIGAYNDQSRGNSFNFAYSDDDVSYTAVASADYTSPVAASGSPSAVFESRFVSITGINITTSGAGRFFYFRWLTDDAAGGGSRDEMLLDNIVINTNPACTPAVVSSIAPTSGAPGTVVTISGTDLDAADDILYDGNSIGYTIVNPTTITATIPGSAVVGTIDNLTVVDNDCVDAISGQTFEVDCPDPAPSVASFVPASGPEGTVIAIEGSNLSLVDDIEFDGSTVATSDWQYLSTEGRILFTLPSGLTTSAIHLINGCATGTSATDFEVLDESCQSPAVDLFISEYSEGSSSYKFLEIANFTGAPVALSGYKIRMFRNRCCNAFGSASTDEESNLGTLTGGLTLNNGEVVVIANDGFFLGLGSPPEFGDGDPGFSGICSFSGNDGIQLLTSSNVVIDEIGTGGGTFASQTTLTRDPIVDRGNTTYTPGEWSTTGISNSPADGTADIGMHTYTGPSLGTPPTITTQPVDQNVCQGETATFSVISNNPGSDTYQWFRAVYRDGSVTDYSMLSNSGDISGATSASLSIANVDATDDQTQYYCLVDDGTGSCDIKSVAAQLTVRGIGGTPGVWTGATDGDWTNCENWDDGQVPTASTDVVINDANTINPLDMSTLPVIDPLFSPFTEINSLTLDVTGGNQPINNLPDDRSLRVIDNVNLVNGYLPVSSFPYTPGSAEGSLVVANDAVGAVLFINGFVAGLLQREVAGTSAYAFPVGDPTNGLNVVTVDFITAPTAVLTQPITLRAAYRSDQTPSIPAAIQNSTECGIANADGTGYDAILGDHIWWVEPPLLGMLNATTVEYDIIIRPSESVAGDYTPISGNTAATIMKAPSTVAGHSWTLNGTCAPGIGVSDLNAPNPIVTRTGLTGFSDFTVIYDQTVSPFPVEWLHFNAERVSETEVALDWATAVEENNEGFYLQRSTDGVFFEDFGFEKGAGTAKHIRKYTALDNQASSERLYYRLRQVDFDGKTDFSNVVEIAPMGASTQDFSLSLYPNPFQSGVSIKSDLPASSQVSMALFSVDGKRIYSQVGAFGEVSSAFESYSADLSAGAYLLQIGAQGQRKNIKLIKQ